MKTSKNYIFSFKISWKFFPSVFLSFFLLSSLLLPHQQSDSLEKKLNTLSGKEKVDLLNQLAVATGRTSNAKSSSYADQAFQLAREINYRYGEAVATRTIGFGFYQKNDLEKAEPKFKNALQIFLQLKDSFQLCETYNQIGLLYWKKNSFVQAYQQYRASLIISRAKHFKKQEAQALNYIGLIYWKWSEFSSALDYFFQALRIKESLKDDFEIGVTLNNIANMYNELDRPDDAIQFANRSMVIVKKFPNKYVLGRALNNLGVSYFKKSEYEKAIIYQNKSLSIKIESVDVSGQAFSLSDLGEVYFAKNDYKKAIEYYQKALVIWQGIHDGYGLAKTMLNLGKVYARLGYVGKAEAELNNSLFEGKHHQNKLIIAQVYLALSLLYEAKADWKQALAFHKLYSVYSDSVLNISTSDKISEFRVINEIDEKEKEVELLNRESKIQLLEIEKHQITNKIFLIVTIAGVGFLLLLIFRFIKIRKLKILLEEKNEAISLKSKELEEANAAKDKFFSIIAHDLKSPFTGLLGYTEILVEEFDSMEQEEKVNTIGYLKTLIERVYRLIENLLDWSRIQTDRIELISEVIELETELPEILALLKANAEKKQITIINKITTPFTVFLDNYSFRSIVQNLISNAIKFTNPGGEITIWANEKNDFVELFVSDNGIGINSELLKKIFNIETRHSTKGTDNEVGTGLGLLLCKELAEKNGGAITIESQVERGTTIRVTLPKQK